MIDLHVCTDKQSYKRCAMINVEDAELSNQSLVFVSKNEICMSYLISTTVYISSRQCLPVFYNYLMYIAKVALKR